MLTHDQGKTSRVDEPLKLFAVQNAAVLLWPFRVNYQEKESDVVDWEESWWWFSVMQMYFFVVDFSLESDFQSSYSLQQTAMMLGYGSRLQRASRSFLWGSVQLTCKNDLSIHGGGLVTQQTWQHLVLSCFPTVSQVLQGTAWEQQMTYCASEIVGLMQWGNFFKVVLQFATLRQHPSI